MDKQPFYLTKRTLKSGHCVFYYYFYDNFGNRTVPRTTNKTRKKDALAYCIELLRCNNLENNKIRFKTFAYNFFDDNSSWCKDRALAREIAENTLIGYRSALKQHLLPYFGEMFIDRISTADIKDFRVFLAETKGLANKTINNIVACVRLIFEQAVEENVIRRNPVNSSIKNLTEDNKRDAFTEEEVKQLFSTEWNNHAAWLFTLTASLTGMRFSEILGLQPKHLHEGYIEIEQQYNRGKVKPTKGKAKRFVTIPDELRFALLANKQGSDFIFGSHTDITKPLARNEIVKEFKKHYTEEMLKSKDKRILTFHSLRHFFNTYLISNDITPSKVNFTIGHSEGKGSMLALYTSWKPNMYKDVLELQTKLMKRLTETSL